MTNITFIPHPFYPPTIQLPHYVTNASQVLSLISQFAFLWAAVIGIAFLVIRNVRPTASRSDQLAFVWMWLRFIHLFFEAYFVVHHRSLAGSQELFGQLWKEYSLSDSRYLTSDSFLVSMEAITAFCWGPLAFFIAYCIAVQHPVRHALQLIMSLGQVYGDVLYYATSMFGDWFHGVSFCRPEGYYFWFYYFFFNAIWMVIGSYYVYQSATEITRAFKRIGELDREVKGK
ncbi:emopamil binding protein [Aspergillus terreus]|uniref:Emopamil binding protein n=1 Tax=Aspergillus terreus TaxID=33178 RepID=A0A5M3YUX4_ASPTE|nr:hypothetical protein ATETN484_0004060100 [Aspergillus terreus]GFF13490.1 emopamil binding protein [Aspergillus terreus]